MSDAKVRFALGTRMAVRARIVPPPEHGPRLTDTVGEVVAVDGASVTLESRRGPVVLSRSEIVAAKVVPPRPVRRGAPHRAVGVADLHRVMTEGNPPLERAWIGDPGRGWLLRAAGGYTGRANSLLPLGDPGVPLPEAVEMAAGWHRERGLRPLVMLPGPPGSAEVAVAADPLGAELLRRGYTPFGPPVLVLTGESAEVAGAEVVSTEVAGAAPAETTGPGQVVVREQPTEGWWAACGPAVAAHGDVARRVVTGPADQRFLSVEDGPEVLGVVRVPVNDGWAGIFGLSVPMPHRRLGIGRRLSVAAARVAHEAGVRSLYLQVESTNEAALTLYRDLGLRPHHAYQYLRLP